jgi:hypothetical protein
MDSVGSRGEGRTSNCPAGSPTGPGFLHPVAKGALQDWQRSCEKRPVDVAARSRARVYREEDACVQQTQLRWR